MWRYGDGKLHYYSFNSRKDSGELLFSSCEPMHDFLANHGYLALFLLSFLASTLIPLGSEWLLVAMLPKNHDPVLSVVPRFSMEH